MADLDPPLVTAIMPTRDRPEFSDQSLDEDAIFSSALSAATSQ
jgi:hypothetical protein